MSMLFVNSLLFRIKSQARLLKGEWGWRRTNLALRTRGWWPLTAAAREERQALQLLADLDGPLAQSELRWLYRQVRALPEDATIMELNAGVGQVTGCLALGCWGSRRHVYTLWADAGGDWNTEVGQTFVIWHQNVIRKHLVPYVTPVLLDRNGAIPPCPNHVALLYVGQDPVYSHTEISIDESVLSGLLPRALIVQRREPLLQRPQLKLAVIGTVGSLFYGYWLGAPGRSSNVSWNGVST